jgi:hypothetical protein
MEYELDANPQDTITVFWPANFTKNSFIKELDAIVKEINNININKINENTKECLDIISRYNTIISKIKGLSDCLHFLLKQNTFNKFEKYNDDFKMKASKIHQHIISTLNINISFDKFLNFMYKNTCEGRIILQNNYAINKIQHIKNAEDYIINIKNIIYKPVQNNTSNSTKYVEDDEYDSDEDKSDEDKSSSD